MVGAQNSGVSIALSVCMHANCAYYALHSKFVWKEVWEGKPKKIVRHSEERTPAAVVSVGRQRTVAQERETNELFAHAN